MKTKKLLSILLTLAMLATLLVVVPVSTVSAESGVTVYSADTFSTTGANDKTGGINLRNYMQNGNVYTFEFNVKPQSIDTSYPIRVDLGFNSSGTSAGQFGIYFLYHQGEGMYYPFYKSVNYYASENHASQINRIASEGINFKYCWNTVSGIVYATVTYPNGHKTTHTYTPGVISDGNFGWFYAWSPHNAVTVSGLTITKQAEDEVLYQNSSWSFSGVQKLYVEQDLNMMAGNSYLIEFDIDSPGNGSNNPCFLLDWRNGDTSKSNISSWNYKAITGIYDDGEHDCVAVGTAPGWVWTSSGDTMKRGTDPIKYHYRIIWDTQNSTFDITLDRYNPHESTVKFRRVKRTVTGSGPYASGDNLRFETSNSLTATVKNLVISRYVPDANAPVYEMKTGDWTITGEHNYLFFESSLGGLTAGKNYLINFKVEANSGGYHPEFSFDWRSSSNVTKSGNIIWQQSEQTAHTGIFGIFDGGENDCVGIGSGFNVYPKRSTPIEYDVSILWNTSTSVFDVLIRYGENGFIQKSVTGTGTFASNDVLKFTSNSSGGATIKDFKIYVEPSTVYTAANGWNKGVAREQADGKLKLAKTGAYAASFTPSLESNKVYEITYDVSGLKTVDDSWTKPFVLTLSAGGQTEENVITYRQVGSWRDVLTDQEYAVGSNGTNKVVINTGTGEWETYALGTKATYSGYTTSLNNKTRTYNAFSNPTDFTLKFYSYNGDADLDTPCISNVTVTDITPEPTPTPTPTPTPAPVAPEVDMGKAVKAANGANAFYYVIDITLNGGTPSSFEVTYHPEVGPGKSDTTPAQVYSFTEMNNVAVKLISVLKGIPSGELDREIVCDTRLTYTFGEDPGGTIEKSETCSYNEAR